MFISAHFSKSHDIMIDVDMKLMQTWKSVQCFINWEYVSVRQIGFVTFNVKATDIYLCGFPEQVGIKVCWCHDQSQRNIL